jgi:hypothetical protein
MNKYLLFLAVFLCIPLHVNANEDGFSFTRNRRSISMPIKVRNNLAVVPLYINDRGPFYFIIDTGVRTTILTEPILAHLLDLDMQESIYVYGLGGDGIVQALLARNVDIRMHGLRGKNMNMIVIPEDILVFSEIFGFPVYGVIGYDLFKNFPIEVNYSNERMRIFRDTNYRISRRSHQIPFELVNDKPYVSATIVGEDGDLLTTNLLLDLGASHPLYLNRSHIHLSDRTIHSFIGKGISGNLMGDIGRAEKIRIGDIEIEKPIVFYPEREFLVFNELEIDWQGLIGGAIIKRFNVIIDYPSEKLILRPGGDFSEPFTTNLSGLEVIASGPQLNRFKIHYVRPGSVAYEAGIQSGDYIMQINDMRHNELNLDKILDVINLREGHYVSMLVNRDGILLRKHFRLREDL